MRVHHCLKDNTCVGFLDKKFISRKASISQTCHPNGNSPLPVQDRKINYFISRLYNTRTAKSYTHVLSIRSLAKLEYGIALFRRFLRRKMGDNFAPAGETPAEKTTGSGQMRAPGTETVVGHNVGDVLYRPFTVTEVQDPVRQRHFVIHHVRDLKDHF